MQAAHAGDQEQRTPRHLRQSLFLIGSLECHQDSSHSKGSRTDTDRETNDHDDHNNNTEGGNDLLFAHLLSDGSRESSGLKGRLDFPDFIIDAENHHQQAEPEDQVHHGRNRKVRSGIAGVGAELIQNADVAFAPERNGNDNGRNNTENNAIFDVMTISPYFFSIRL